MRAPALQTHVILSLLRASTDIFYKCCRAEEQQERIIQSQEALAQEAEARAVQRAQEQTSQGKVCVFCVRVRTMSRVRLILKSFL